MRRILLIVVLVAATSLGFAQTPIYKSFSKIPGVEVAEMYRVPVGGHRETVTLIRCANHAVFANVCQKLSLRPPTDTAYRRSSLGITIAIRDRRNPALPPACGRDGKTVWRKSCVMGVSYSLRTIYIYSRLRSGSDFRDIVELLAGKQKQAGGSDRK